MKYTNCKNVDILILINWFHKHSDVLKFEHYLNYVLRRNFFSHKTKQKMSNFTKNKYKGMNKEASN